MVQNDRDVITEKCKGDGKRSSTFREFNFEVAYFYDKLWFYNPTTNEKMRKCKFDQYMTLSEAKGLTLPQCRMGKRHKHK